MKETTFEVDKENLETRMSGIFNASFKKIWKVLTDPKMVGKWWGPKELLTVVEKMEIKPGGEWRYVQTDREGNKYVFYGKFLEIKEPDYITWTFNYQPIGPDHEITETIRLEQIEEKKTKITTDSHYKNLKDLEGMVDSGMERGARESWDRLEKLVNGN